jgi:L-amino acid N-acyltransferase YncA
MLADHKAARNGLMTTSDLEIDLATPDDIPGIVALQNVNLLANGGALSIQFSKEWFERVLSEMPIIVARRDGRVVGYLVSSPLTAAANSPITQAKLRAYPGSHNPYNHGPVCIAKEERSQGLLVGMFGALRKRLRGREGVAFVRRDNAVSLAAHSKLGMRQAAEFTHDGVAYVVVAYIA